MNAMAGTIEELKAKIAAIQDSEAMVFDPNAEKLTLPAVAPTPIAQEGDGA